MIFTLKGRIATGIGICLAIISVFYWGLYAPGVKALEGIRSELKMENLKIVRMKEKINEYKEVQKEYDIIEEELFFLEEHLLERDKISSFFNELSLRGKTYGIEYMVIIPEKIIPQEYYDRVPVKMQLYSTYHASGEFLSDVARRPKMGSLTVENIEMKRIDSRKAASLTEQENHTTEVNLSMFIYSKKNVSQGLLAEGEQNQGSLSAVNKGVEVDTQAERIQSRRR